MSARGPWHVQPDENSFVVQFLDSEELRFGPWTAEEHAANFARRLNQRWIKQPRRRTAARPMIAGASR
jgi:hypothetical protein